MKLRITPSKKAETEINATAKILQIKKPVLDEEDEACEIVNSAYGGTETILGSGIGMISEPFVFIIITEKGNFKLFGDYS